MSSEAELTTQAGLVAPGNTNGNRLIVTVDEVRDEGDTPGESCTEDHQGK